VTGKARRSSSRLGGSPGDISKERGRERSSLGGEDPLRFKKTVECAKSRFRESQSTPGRGHVPAVDALPVKKRESIIRKQKKNKGGDEKNIPLCEGMPGAPPDFHLKKDSKGRVTAQLLKGALGGKGRSVIRWRRTQKQSEKEGLLTEGNASFTLPSQRTHRKDELH